MRAAPLLLLAPLLGSCVTPSYGDDVVVPGAAQMDAVERALAGHACIGALDRWERRYAFNHLRWEGARNVQDETRVAFTFLEAGIDGRTARRRVDAPPELDHGQYRLASGRYELATGKLEIYHCGWNCGGDVPRGGSCG